MHIVQTTLAAAYLAVAAGSVAAQQLADQRLEFNIPAQPVEDALNRLANESGIQVGIFSKISGGMSSPAVKGKLTPREALAKILSESPLHARWLDDHTVTIYSSADRTTWRSNSEPSALEARSNAGEVREANDDGVGNRLRVAQAETVAGTTSITPTSAVESGMVKLEEVVVTAQKRAERLQDVPVPVSVLNTQALADNAQDRIQDYFASVPGLNLNSSPSVPGGGRQYVQIRGLGTTAFSTPTVGLLIDDVPFGGSTGSSAGSLLFPDIDPSDLSQIEVLKGPQSTLYGADSLGGLIKYVTKDPTTSGFSGHIQMLGDGVANGGFGYGLRAAVNIPISNTFAFRVSAFTRQDPGYIQNVTTGQTNVNSVNVYGGRIGTLWKLSDAVSLKVSALFQNTDGNGDPTIAANASLQPALGDLQQTGLPATGTYTSQVRLYTATLNAKLAGADITAITGYGISKLNSIFDQSASLGFFADQPAPLGFGVAGATAAQGYRTEKFSQEVRLSASVGSWLSWLGGLFYTHETGDHPGYINANEVSNGAYVGTLLYQATPQTFSEYAVFGDLTFHLTDRFDVQLGGRGSWNDQTYDNIASGLLTETFYGVASPYIQPVAHSADHAFTYLVTPEFKISPDLMVYARLASGYRVGGPNTLPLPAGTPTSYKPDTTRDYEVGIKSDILDHRLTVDASLYDIDWHDIQLNVFIPPSVGYNTNGGSAKSEGVELSVQARPATGTEIFLSGAYNSAQLTQDLPQHSTLYGLDGDRLPFSSRFSGSVSVDQDILHIDDLTGFAGISASYIGLRYGEFRSTAAQARFTYPAYTVINAHTGARIDSWNVNLFVNNINNRRGITGGNVSSALNTTGYFSQLIQPRTFGISISKSF